MKVARFPFFWLLSLFHYSSASLSWSKSYTLKAVLTVPAANLSEPYQVWLDGDSDFSRVDFYDGLVKLYREKDLSGQYQYYKIQPETTKMFNNIDVCHQIAASNLETKMYALNTYLPVRNFKFKHNGKLNSVDAQLWEAFYVLDQKLNTSITYTVWVYFNGTSDGMKTAIPLRYVYEMKIGENLLDYFQHDYSYFSDSKPENSVVEKPLGLQCYPLVDLADEAVDPLLEYIEPQIEDSRVTKVFDKFKKKHGKTYGNENENIKRLIVFKNNLRYINSINRQHRSYSLGVNHLADLTDKETNVFMGTIHTQKEIDDYDDFDHDDNNDEDDDANEKQNIFFDWRQYGAITSVKDQTTLCGSCYAFTTAAVVESVAYISRGCNNLVELSEQVLVDCTWESGNLGCSGGTYEHTLEWVQSNGIPSKEEYGPYLALEGRCHIKNMTKLVPIQNYVELPRKKQIIKDALRQRGPLLVSVDSSPKSYTLYTGGVYDDPVCRSEPHKRTHALTLVGYGKEGDQEYWILKNSFGPGWGEKGYMRLATKGNRCGLKNFVHAVRFHKSQIDKCTKQ